MINSKSNTRNLNMKLKHLISLVLLIALIGTVSATTQEYGNFTDFVVNSTQTLSNYQVKMILSNATGYTASSGLFYTNGTTRSDWMDVKWTDTSNTTLSFWKENRTDTATNTTWWIKVPSIANNNSTKIRLFYGNASQTTSSMDGSATFEFFDDFPGISLNTSKWTSTGNPPTIANSNVTVQSAGTSTYIKGIPVYGINNSFMFRANIPKADAANYGGAFNLTTFQRIRLQWEFYTVDYKYKAESFVTGSSTYTILSAPSVGYHVWEIERDAGTSHYFLVDNVVLATHTGSNVGTGFLPPFLESETNGVGFDTDWFVVRKYQNPEPFLTLDTVPIASFSLNKNYLRIPNSVTATDTSTNTPTSWQWSWGDGTANSTTQNPSHQYLKRGKCDIVLTATNAGGSGTTGATSVKVVGYENYY